MLFKICDEASDSDSESSNDYSDDETEFFEITWQFKKSQTIQLPAKTSLSKSVKP